MAVSGKCKEEVNDYYDNVSDNSDNDLLNQLVNDCNAPIKYLERRGYLQKGKLKPVKLDQEEKRDLKYKKNFFYFPKRDHLHENKNPAFSEDSPKKLFEKSTNVYVDGDESENTEHLLEKLSNGATAAVADGHERILKTTVKDKESSLEESEPNTKDTKVDVKDDPGFFGKVKHKFQDIFGLNLNEDIGPEDIDSNGYLDETFSGLYPDDSELDDEYDGMYNDFLMPDQFPNSRFARSDPIGSNAGADPTTERLSVPAVTTKKVESSCNNKSIGEPLPLDDDTTLTTSTEDKGSSSGANKAAPSGNSSGNQTTASKDEELFKNLTEIDRAFVKGFLNCYLENKKKFSLGSIDEASKAKSPPKNVTGNVNITTVDANATNSSKVVNSQSTNDTSQEHKTTSTEAPKPSTTKPSLTTTTKAVSTTPASTTAAATYPENQMGKVSKQFWKCHSSNFHFS